MLTGVVSQASKITDTIIYHTLTFIFMLSQRWRITSPDLTYPPTQLLATTFWQVIESATYGYCIIFLAIFCVQARCICMCVRLNTYDQLVTCHRHRKCSCVRQICSKLFIIQTTNNYLLTDSFVACWISYYSSILSNRKWCAHIHHHQTPKFSVKPMKKQVLGMCKISTASSSPLNSHISLIPSKRTFASVLFY